MKLKEVSSSDEKWAYDPYKMDCWALGMCFSASFIVAFRFRQHLPMNTLIENTNLITAVCEHPNLALNLEVAKGPGSEFKWAQQFHSSGAAGLLGSYVIRQLRTDIRWIYYLPTRGSELEMCVMNTQTKM